jgi:hypothetical protein
VTDRGRLRYSAASNPREEIMSVPNLVGHGSVILGSTGVEPIDLKRASVCRILALAKAEALKESEQQWGRTVEPLEV